MAWTFGNRTASVTVDQYGDSRQITFAGMTPDGDTPDNYVTEMNKFAAIAGRSVVVSNKMVRRVSEGVVEDG